MGSIPNYILAITMLLGFSTSSYSQKTIAAKVIEENMEKVNDSLYAHRYETSNRDYNVFLKELRAKDSVTWAVCAMDSVRWTMIPYAYGEPLWPRHVQYTGHPAFSEHPATNMRYEGAVEYCNWLTSKYNADPKRKFKKVVFLLPSKKEWIDAAHGGHPDWMFPWGNYYMVNKKGFFMCNFKPVDEPYFVRDSLGEAKIVGYDGSRQLHGAEFPEEKGFYTMKVKSFTANEFGLYNVCGNAAEMITDKGSAMGGSWNSYAGEITPRSIKRYPDPSPEVGFRVFMKIIER
jgi:formylglycine-generating enzyme required for sulfatase activity